MKLVHRGKVKDVYETQDGNLLFHFSDRISAFDVIMDSLIPKKGEVLCRFAEFWFNKLEMSNHMIKTVDNDKILVKKLQMIPIESIVRGYFYGSFVDRYNDLNGKCKSLLPRSFRPILATKLPYSIFDPTTKSEDHDQEIIEKEIVPNILSKKDYDFLKKTSLKLYDDMSKLLDACGFIISDVKFEFGIDEKGNIQLADSLGPDEYRLWLKHTYTPGVRQDSYDKQLLRDWLINSGFKKKVDDLSLRNKKPKPPTLPTDIINKISQRYIYAYEKISGRNFYA
ncbi:MAG: phosphoribosylaminoimidazolesuccinocarboxamide synthase [Nitrososphaeraceae archaeon]